MILQSAYNGLQPAPLLTPVPFPGMGGYGVRVHDDSVMNQLRHGIGRGGKD